MSFRSLAILSILSLAPSAQADFLSMLKLNQAVEVQADLILLPIDPIPRRIEKSSWNQYFSPIRVGYATCALNFQSFELPADSYLAAGTPLMVREFNKYHWDIQEVKLYKNGFKTIRIVCVLDDLYAKGGKRRATWPSIEEFLAKAQSEWFMNFTGKAPEAVGTAVKLD